MVVVVIAFDLNKTLIGDFGLPVTQDKISSKHLFFFLHYSINTAINCKEEILRGVTTKTI
jgi:hypothetical protein